MHSFVLAINKTLKITVIIGDGFILRGKVDEKGSFVSVAVSVMKVSSKIYIY